jgi:hypothetical protein
LYFCRERFPGSRLIYSGRETAWKNAVFRKQIQVQSESIPADICLGVAIAGVNTLIGIGLILVFA